MSNPNKTITIRALGVSGNETMVLRIGGSTVQTWNNVGTGFTDYAYTAYQSGNIQVAFTNDAAGRDLRIDYIRVQSTTIQAENRSTNTGVWQNNSCGGSNSEWLHCNGYIDFGDRSSITLTANLADLDARDSTVLEIVKQEGKPYPNPVEDFLNLPMENITKVEIFGFDGSLVKSDYTPIFGNKGRIDVSLFKPGLYFLQVLANGKTTTYKFIKR